jgi:lariat debranching enzyme
MGKIKIAVCGCSHGEMDTIYERLAQMEYEGGFKAELLICCGDYQVCLFIFAFLNSISICQSVRNYADLECMACPPKYRSLQTFYKYYSGECRAPVLTIFIGGNHEASRFVFIVT